MGKNEERPDIKTRFKKGQSGNPRGRPKGRQNDDVLLREALFKPIRVSDSHGSRSVPKLVAAMEVCLNKALKGDVTAFAKIMIIADRLKLTTPSLPTYKSVEVRHVIVDPVNSTEINLVGKISDA